MRILAGRHKGRALAAPKGRTTRPTTSRAREGLFNILAHGRLGKAGDALAGARVLEAFAGTGAFAFEALSRGASRAVLMDLDENAVAAARKTARRLGEERHTRILRMDAVRPRAAREAANLVFMDPPYGRKLAVRALQALARKGWIAADALCVVELGADEPFHPPPGFAPVSERTFGAARFVILRFEGD